jgi:RNA polymerase sigma-70 factor (ECF subfamily)
MFKRRPVRTDVSASDAPGRIDAGALFLRYGRFVARFLWKMGVEAQELDDLVQEIFLVAHRRGGFLPGRARPTTWLGEIALRVVSTRKRSSRRRPDQPDPKALARVASGAHSPTDAVEAWESLERVRRALERVDLAHRAVFVLFELEGEPCEDIAAALDVPVGTVYSRLHKARRLFLEAYGRLERSARAAAPERARGEDPMIVRERGRA